MITKRVGSYIFRTAFAAALSIVVSIGSVPSVLCAQQTGADDTVLYSESDHAPSADELSADEPCEAGQVLVLYDNLAAISDEELVGGSGAVYVSPVHL